jgi:hypothetical protein
MLILFVQYIERKETNKSISFLFRALFLLIDLHMFVITIFFLFMYNNLTITIPKLFLLLILIIGSYHNFLFLPFFIFLVILFFLFLFLFLNAHIHGKRQSPQLLKIKEFLLQLHFVQFLVLVEIQNWVISLLVDNL